MDLESPLRIRVTVADGPLAGERFICAQPRIQLGRANKNDIILKDDSTISASHAVLFWKEEGWYISDNGSTNGTYLLIEGKKIRVRKPVRIAQGQLFFLGSTSVHFDAPNEDAEFETTEEFQQEADTHVPLGPRMPAQQMHISERDEQLRIRMSSIKPISAEYTLPFQERDIRMLSSALRDGVLLFNHTSGSEQSGQEGILESSLVKLGEWLQNQCFPRPVQNELAKSANSDLLLTLDPSLVHIPWELAVVNGRPMCLQFNMGRQIVLPYRSKLGGMVSEKNDKRLLIVANPDETLPEAQNHGEELYYKIIMNYPQVHVELLAGARATKIDVLSRMQNCDMIYYIGHTEYCDDERGQSSWLLKDDRLTSQDFENIHTPPGLVFANSCDSGREGSWEGTDKHLISKKGVAGGFIMAGVTNYIGALWPIPAESSVVFANSFFDAVLTGTPVGQSLRLARLGASDRFGKGNPIWASYVLYGNPSHIHV